jgi:hypothetical protein
LRWQPQSGWQCGEAPPKADLVLYFGSVEAIEASEAPAVLARDYPGAVVLGCSSGTGILGENIDETGIVGVACHFRDTRLRLVETPVPDASQSAEVGRTLGHALRGEGLAAAIMLSDGIDVDGSAITAGMVEALGPGIPVSGGLAGDGARFERTYVGADMSAGSGRAAALGFYGSSLRISHGSAGGWQSFGPRRRITRAHGCVLEEVDGKPALTLYERYLGDEAAGLPATALFFPLMIWNPDSPDETRVRTVMSIDRAAGTMTFAGDIPQGWGAQLMRGHFDGLVDGAGEAAEIARTGLSAEADGQTLALLISCVGRRLLLGQRTEDELVAVGAAFGRNVTCVGFYSHGEIAPAGKCGTAVLHNETMTVTLLAEAP